MKGIPDRGRLVLLALVSVSCATTRIGADFDAAAPFSSLETYRWLDSAGVSDDLTKLSPFLERRLRRAINHTLELDGFSQRDSGTVSFFVSTFVIAPEQGYVVRPEPSITCGAPTLSFWIRTGRLSRYPWGYPWRFPRARYYYRYPWGYACSYRIGFGYTWVPMYHPPARQLPGTVVIDILDGQTQELIWRGWSEGALAGPYADIEQEQVDRIVATILAGFPPGR